MSDTLFNSNDEYLKLAYIHEDTLTRPASTFETIYTYTLEHTDTDYIPIVFAEYTDPDGRTFQCKIFTGSSYLPTSLSPVVVDIETSTNKIIFYVLGSAADANSYQVGVRAYILMESLVEVT